MTDEKERQWKMVAHEYTLKNADLQQQIHKLEGELRHVAIKLQTLRQSFEVVFVDEERIIEES